MFIYGIYDRKTARYTGTYTDFADEGRKRTFQTLANDPSTYIGLYPEDYELWVLGNLDDQTGIIIPGKEYLDTGRKEIKQIVRIESKAKEDNT